MSDDRITQPHFNDGSAAKTGERDGLSEQVILLSRLSKELDVYFSL